MDPGRRALLATALGACALPWLPRPAAAQSTSKTRLILLGTGGGPRPRKAFAATSQVIIANGTAYLVDCGDGVARQLAAAGVPPVPLRHVFITHQHSDHNADYGNLFLLLWAFLPPRVDAWGPPPLAQMTKLFFEMNAFDINTRIEDEGRLPLVPIVHPHEVSQGGVVMKDENVTVTAALVDHPPIENAFAYRFDAPDRSIVISGDTAPSKNLVALAKGADVLVHEALWVPAVDRIVKSVPNSSRLEQHIIDSHTSAEDCGRMAAEAGVKTLVLSHLVPPDDPQITDQMWIDAAQKHFRGTIVVGKDLMEI
jgi:ribonuclease BN (tRNA processing enzyme)